MASSAAPVPSGYRARPATHDDLPAIDRLYLASEQVLGVLPEPRAFFLRWVWSQPYVEPSRDTRVIERDGEIVGFSMTHHDGLGGPLRSMGRTHPSHTGHGIGHWLVSRALAQARDRGIRGVRTAAPREDAAARALFLASGFSAVRTTFDMGTGLTGRETPGDPPAGVTIRRSVRGPDDRAAWQVETAAFRDHWDHAGDVPFEIWESEWFGTADTPTWVLLAEADGGPVGEAAWVAVEDGAYIVSVGVLAAYRRRGIAGALLRRAMADTAAAGHRDVSLSVDADSPTGAVGVYERAGLHIRRTADVFEHPAR